MRLGLFRGSNLSRARPPAPIRLTRRSLAANTFKASLLARERSLGLWCSSASPQVAELLAHSGLDW